MKFRLHTLGEIDSQKLRLLKGPAGLMAAIPLGRRHVSRCFGKTSLRTSVPEPSDRCLSHFHLPVASAMPGATFKLSAPYHGNVSSDAPFRSALTPMMIIFGYFSTNTPQFPHNETWPLIFCGKPGKPGSGPRLNPCGIRLRMKTPLVRTIRKPWRYRLPLTHQAIAIIDKYYMDRPWLGVPQADFGIIQALTNLDGPCYGQDTRKS